MVGTARQVAALAAVITATLGTTAARGAESFSVVGACRTGLPNGAYELRMSDGRLRVAGAFAQGRKTGTFIFWTASGARSAVIPYDDDTKTGTVALWYTAAGRELARRIEAPYADNRLHGIVRAFYSNGALRAELRYEHGTMVAAQAWDQRGARLSLAQTQRLAAGELEAAERVYSGLEAIVHEHPPHCE
jgi:antitoxin component YwqK of YwqJK toxin-antitoxin module